MLGLLVKTSRHLLSFSTQLRQGLLYISGVVARWQFLPWHRLFMLQRLGGLQLMRRL
jgi:hypothetical protein